MSRELNVEQYGRIALLCNNHGLVASNYLDHYHNSNQTFEQMIKTIKQDANMPKEVKERLNEGVCTV
ncbi:MAG: hypothetical protein LKF42_09875 [Streptococcaceae bacterium]|jgi:hypothetical protein|nr:hypothetical protein [Streptococcaceae bacterium]